MRDLWRWFLIEGIVLCVLGFLAIVVPPIAGLAATVLLGWLLLAAGIVGLLATLRARQAPGFGWSLLSAVIAILAGLALLWNPLQGLFTLTYVLVAYFIFDGIFMIVFALEHRRQLSDRWAWMLFNGVIDLVLAAIVISGFPGTFVWALGLLLGVDMMFGGAALIAMALAARDRVAV
jgi:uncharacterized membrane protein HdeD (DUF308 family)